MSSPAKSARLTLLGGCHCGAVRFEVDAADKKFAVICHCALCQRLNGAICSAYVGFKPEAIKLTQGEDQLVCFASSQNMDRYSCAKCSSSVLNKSKLPGPGSFWDAPVTAFDRENGDGPISHYEEVLKPTGHMFYPRRICGEAFANDGLKKWATYPGAGVPME